MAVFLQPGLTQREVGDHLLAVKSNVSTHLSKLESRGLILRETDENDARNKRLVLTTKGNSLVKKCFSRQNELVASMVADVSDAELKMLENVMQRVSIGLDEILDEH